MKKFLLLTFIYACLAFPRAIAAQELPSQPPPGHSAPHEHGGLELLPEGLFGVQLTSEQILAVKQIISDNIEQWEILANDVRTISSALDDAVNLDTFDEQSVRDAAKNLEATQEEQLVMKAQITANVRAILTEAQRASLDLMRLSHTFAAPAQNVDPESSAASNDSDAVDSDVTDSNTAESDSSVYETDETQVDSQVTS